MKSHSVAVFFMVSLLCSPALKASDVNSLIKLLRNISTLTGEFTQTIVDEEGQELENSQGFFDIARPSKMAWKITTPLEQQIISNGELLWLYDPDLDQVIIESAKLSFNNSPIALFTSDLSLISQRYKVKSKSTDSHSNFELTPNDSSSMFDKIRVNFVNELPRSIDLLDRFSHKTTIFFDKVELNKIITDSTFNFIPPPNIDIVNNVR
jgi:outer membrane lipoprotein carrier protein